MVVIKILHEHNVITDRKNVLYSRYYIEQHVSYKSLFNCFNGNYLQKLSKNLFLDAFFPFLKVSSTCSLSN